MNREFLMLAQEMPAKPSLGSWKLSEKLDGIRALWIPESRGQSFWACPWANDARKGAEHGSRICTGLWSRYGNIIQAPSWWLDLLPPFCVDGELYLGRGRFQDLTSIVKAWRSERDWKPVAYYLIDSPSYAEVFVEGQINNPNYKKYIEGVPSLLAGSVRPTVLRFDMRYRALLDSGIENTVVNVHRQHTLDWRTADSYQETLAKLKEITDKGGEGVVVRNPMTPWEPKRSSSMYKLKPHLDSEGTVVGYTKGKGRLLGMAGALVVSWNGLSFELAGLTDLERSRAEKIFPIGTQVTFLYRELTNEGKPKEARYYRKRHSL